MIKMLLKTSIGDPVMIGNSVLRIVGYSYKGKWDGLVHTMPILATPEGSIIVSGLGHLKHLTTSAKLKLDRLEENSLAMNVTLYNDRLTLKHLGR